ncbi:Retrovirus-related Pol polyprotein from transposon RE2 [Cardamine amara subsp. amara]|uniref:Retrovirus-related Pol polyprotein from transposon RE2 n=1 Tax=Cardamine amara subsp. amara TaxID=228776 RepID=A0ABD0ZS92_CARAN
MLQYLGTIPLLSVSKLTKDYPCSFEFDCDNVCVNDKETKRLLTRGNHSKGLYVLRDKPIQVFYSTRQHCASDEVWHMRLGHPNTKILQYLSTTKAISINKSTKKMCEALIPKCWHRFDNSYQHEELPAAMTAMRITEITEQGGQEWYPDTGASAHVTSSPHHLQQAKVYRGSDTVMIGDGNYLPITHTGSTSLASTSGTLPLNA